MLLIVAIPGLAIGQGRAATLVGIVAVLVAAGVFGEGRTALNTTLKAQPSDEPRQPRPGGRARFLLIVSFRGQGRQLAIRRPNGLVLGWPLGA